MEKHHEDDNDRDEDLLGERRIQCAQGFMYQAGAIVKWDYRNL